MKTTFDHVVEQLDLMRPDFDAIVQYIPQFDMFQVWPIHVIGEPFGHGCKEGENSREIWKKLREHYKDVSEPYPDITCDDSNWLKLPKIKSTEQMSQDALAQKHSGERDETPRQPMSSHIDDNDPDPMQGLGSRILGSTGRW